MIHIELKVEGVSQDQLERYKEIFSILIEKGCLDGVKGGSVELHFDAQGIFQGPQFHYFPWRRNKN